MQKSSAHTVSKSFGQLHQVLGSSCKTLVGVLLVVQCFRKKFSRTFSEKEILGSKHVSLRCLVFSSSLSHAAISCKKLFYFSQQSMFVGFRKHDFCGFGTNISFGSLSLAVPFSNFVNNCDRMWVKSLLQMESGLKILEDCSQVNHFFEQNRLLDQSIRKILPSKDIGVSLLGNLKVPNFGFPLSFISTVATTTSLIYFLGSIPLSEGALEANIFIFFSSSSSVNLHFISINKCTSSVQISPATGRLQYIDVTGSIDAVIPDFPPAWNMDAIYEVTEYSLVLEGRPEMRGQTWTLEDDLFSCTSLFRSVELERQMKLVIYVHFAWSDVICRDFRIHHSLSCSANPQPGIFHLLHLVHKFPVQPQCHGDLIIPDKCFSFAEATVLPWDLNVATIDGAAFPVSIPQHKLDKNCHSDFAFKRCKTNHSSICSKKVELGSNFNHGNPSCSLSSNFITLPHKRNAHDVTAFPAQISCAIVVQRLNGQRMALSGILFSQDDKNRAMPLASPKKVVLEFDSKNLFKYKFLRIGGYYIMKHSAKKCFCESMDKSLASQVVVNLDTHLYSLSFHFDEIALHSSLYDQSSDSCSTSESSYRCRCYLRNELLFHPCSTAGHGISSDISLHVTSDATSLLDLDIQALKEAIIKLSMRPADVCCTCQSGGCANSLVNLIQDQGTHSSNHLPQGDLVSLEGTVVSLHSGCCAVDKLTCHDSAHDVHHLRFAQGGKNLICLRVLTHCHVVEISGCLYKHNYPIGLGPGADVTFHRVLASSEQGRLLLMPVSFITVNSVKEVVSPAANSLCLVAKGNVPLSLISDLIHCDECKPIRFCCRIVAVQIVMLERNTNLDKVLSDIHPRKVITNIPLAGFILGWWPEFSVSAGAFPAGKSTAGDFSGDQQVARISSYWWAASSLFLCKGDGRINFLAGFRVPIEATGTLPVLPWSSTKLMVENSS
ncbi:hypothetical protein Cgig2_028592 [Carnegiea gigantea]|uniref:CST complex subunit CTC1 n=1 Tax=Carnegiea gigantea TaxID=171969 RepID=A0A9Q1QDF8_9CARY|nr:hypothetical protein Cgig2_028592 [Carnegiea gigantea]